MNALNNMISVIDELGNPFEDDSSGLLLIDSKNVMNDATVAAVLSAKDQGRKNYKQYSADGLASCVVHITDTIKKNNLPL